MSKRTTLPAVVLLLALGTAACSAAGSAGGTAGSPSPTAEPATPTPAGIAHPTGADEIILRYDEVGGFVPVEFIASHVPYFTLYGDGTVIYVSNAPVEWQPNRPMTGSPILAAKLSEEQIQSLLEYALGEGGLAIAREQYDNPLVADAPTAVFEINADGDSKTVSVMALGMEREPGPDTAVLASLGELAERLRDGSIGGQPYVAEAYRGVLTESPGAEGIVIADWPWPGLTVADFSPPEDPNALPQLTRIFTPEEAAATGVTGFENGIQGGLWYRGDDDKVYSFVLRPLLPDDEA
jgi:hypothetical protein